MSYTERDIGNGFSINGGIAEMKRLELQKKMDRLVGKIIRNRKEIESLQSKSSGRIDREDF